MFELLRNHNPATVNNKIAGEGEEDGPEGDSRNNGSNSNSNQGNYNNGSDNGMLLTEYRSAENSKKRYGGSGNYDPQVARSLKYILDTLSGVEKMEDGELGKRIQNALQRLADILEAQHETPARTDSPSIKETQSLIQEISREIYGRKHQNPSLPKPSSADFSVYNNSQTSGESKGLNSLDELSNIQKSESFLRSHFYKEVEYIFYQPDDKTQFFFLSCFAKLPENAVVKRKALT